MAGSATLRVVAEPAEDWRRDSACRPPAADPSSFYAERDRPYEDLPWPSFCRRCPVRADCLSTALRTGETWGVWGGFTPSARQALLRQLLEGSVTWAQVAGAVSAA